jgi:autoinducer 2-degrading protein
MIVRIVKMTFQEGKAEEFGQIFHKVKNKIKTFRGCIFVEILQDLQDPNIFMTYSVWSSEADLERYRNSELFKDTWAIVKVLFSKPAEASSMKRVEKS